MTNINKKTTDTINKFTGGLITNHEFNAGSGYELKDSFVSSFDKTYIGDYARGEWYLKNNMIVCKEHPHGVTIVLKTKAKKYQYIEAYLTDGKIGGDDILGYYGFSHRGGQTFKIGDKIFDENYKPVKEDYTEKQWLQWGKEQHETCEKKLKEKYNAGKTYADMQIENPISAFVPFKLRGKDTIKDWNDALKAAIAISDYLS